MQDFTQFDKTSSSKGYKCPSCGANMHFDPSTQKLLCDHCGTTADFQMDGDVHERSFSELFQTKQWDDEVKVVQCQNCGARQVLKKNQISTHCPFCGSASVLETSQLAGIKPDTVIPFKMDKKQAIANCLKWLKSRFFAPGQFKKNLSLQSIDGCYLPVWTFDCDTTVIYNGRLGKHYTETYVVNGKTMTRTKVKYFNVSGTLHKVYDDIYVKGSNDVDEKSLQKIQPYDMSDYVKYDDKLLAGFSADHYTVEPLDAWEKAEQRIKNMCEGEIVSKHGADEVDYLNIVLQHNSRSFKYLMLPVYVSATNYKNKLYNQYVNGVTGKVTGRVPTSPIKAGLTAVVGVALVVGLVLLLSAL